MIQNVSPSIAQTPFFNPKDFPFTKKLKNTLPTPVHLITLYIPLAITALVETILCLFEKLFIGQKQPQSHPTPQPQTFSLLTWKNILGLLSVPSFITCIRSLQFAENKQNDFAKEDDSKIIDLDQHFIDWMNPSTLTHIGYTLAAIVVVTIAGCYYRSFIRKNPTSKQQNIEEGKTTNLSEKLPKIKQPSSPLKHCYKLKWEELEKLILTNEDANNALFYITRDDITKDCSLHIKNIFNLNKQISNSSINQALKNVANFPFSKEKLEIIKFLLNKNPAVFQNEDILKEILRYSCFWGNLSLYKTFLDSTKIINFSNFFNDTLKQELLKEINSGIKFILKQYHKSNDSVLKKVQNYIDLYEYFYNQTPQKDLKDPKKFKKSIIDRFSISSEKTE